MNVTMPEADEDAEQRVKAFGFDNSGKDGKNSIAMGADVRSVWVAGRMSLSPMPRKLLLRLGWPGSAFRSEKLVALS